MFLKSGIFCLTQANAIICDKNVNVKRGYIMFIRVLKKLNNIVFKN